MCLLSGHFMNTCFIGFLEAFISLIDSVFQSLEPFIDTQMKTLYFPAINQKNLISQAKLAIQNQCFFKAHNVLPGGGGKGGGEGADP